MDLPVDVHARVLSYSDVAFVGRAASVSRSWRTSSESIGLWTALCEARWPAVVSPQLRPIVARRGPKSYYQHRAGLLRPPPQSSDLLDLDDLFFTVDITQGGAVLSSTVHEGRDVLQEDVEVYDSEDADGLQFDGLSARIACADEVFPPEICRVTFTICAVRKSDGRVAVVYHEEVCDDLMEGWSMRGLEQPDRRVPWCPDLRGYLPSVCVSDDPKYLTARGDFAQKWALNGRIAGMAGLEVDASPDHFRVGLGFGTTSEYPFPFPAGGLVAPSDPTLVVHPDFVVEIRRFAIVFTLWLRQDEESFQAHAKPWYGVHGHLELSALHRVLSDRLRFK